MAKSARAHVVKRNRAKLRSTVFGPASDARTERLSAKLQDIASQPKPEDQKESKMELSTSGTDGPTGGTEAKAHADEDMDIDAGSSKASASTSRRSGRIQKRGKRNRSSIVFQTRQSKGKSGQKKK